MPVHITNHGNQSSMDLDLLNLKRKADQYRTVLQNTVSYRQVWKESLRDLISQQLEDLSGQIELGGKVEVRGEMENLEAVVLSLGDAKSGVYQQINDEVQRHLIRHNGSLIYQQLFNGKIIVLIQYPYIENYGEPRPPKTIAIYRPEELRPAFFIRHLEDFLTEISTWEDYDDDEPSQRIGFHMNFGQAPAPGHEGGKLEAES